MTNSQEQKPSLWSKDYIIENLPFWIYSDNPEPTSLEECKAKISSIEYTIKDIDLQIEVRELEMKMGSSRHTTSFDFDRWKTQALRAKQTHTYLLNAYTYWLLLNEKKDVNAGRSINDRLNRVIEILIEEPTDFVVQMTRLIVR